MVSLNKIKLEEHGVQKSGIYVKHLVIKAGLVLLLPFSSCLLNVQPPAVNSWTVRRTASKQRERCLRGNK